MSGQQHSGQAGATWNVEPRLKRQLRALDLAYHRAHFWRNLAFCWVGIAVVGLAVLLIQRGAGSTSILPWLVLAAIGGAVWYLRSKGSDGAGGPADGADGPAAGAPPAGA